MSSSHRHTHRTLYSVLCTGFVFLGFVVGMSRDMITAAIGDADSSVRATARRTYWLLRLRFPDLAESVMGSLAPSMQVRGGYRVRSARVVSLCVCGGVLVFLVSFLVHTTYVHTCMEQSPRSCFVDVLGDEAGPSCPAHLGRSSPSIPHK